MPTVARRGRYDRARLLQKAARAQKRNKPAKAIACFREVLKAEPHDADVQRRLAPLLAAAGETAEAWSLYRRAAQGQRQRGFLDRAIGVYRDAARHVPREIELWRDLAALELERERGPDAVRALREGRTHFTGRRWRSEARALLEEAHRLEPGNLALALDLADARARSGHKDDAVGLIDQLVRSHPHCEAEIRERALRIAPGLRSLRGWLRGRIARREHPAGTPLATLQVASARPRRSQ